MLLYVKKTYVVVFSENSKEYGIRIHFSKFKVTKQL